jgi:hypothetical protein
VSQLELEGIQDHCLLSCIELTKVPFC